MEDMKSKTANYVVNINGFRPYALTKRDMMCLLRSPKIVQRLIYDALHSPPEGRWLKIIREGKPGRETLVETATFERACERIGQGEAPPLLPSEQHRYLFKCQPFVDKLESI